MAFIVFSSPGDGKPRRRQAPCIRPRLEGPDACRISLTHRQERDTSHRVAGRAPPRSRRVGARCRVRRRARAPGAGGAGRGLDLRRRHRRSPQDRRRPVPHLRRADASVSRSLLRSGDAELRPPPRPQRAQARARAGGPPRQPREGLHRRGHALDGPRPAVQPPPRRIVPPEDPERSVVRLPHRGRVALDVPRHGARAGDAPPVALLPLHPAAVRPHGVRAAQADPGPVWSNPHQTVRPSTLRAAAGRCRAPSPRSRWRPPPGDRSRPTTPSR